MEEIFSLPPIAVFDNNYQTVLEFMDTLGNPKFKIAGDVNLSFSDIESLGNLVEVEGRLDLRGTNITSLPDNLHVGGTLNLSNTKITSLPDNLHVGWSLDLSFTKITSLPDNLHVGGSLYLQYTPISKRYSIEEIRKMIEDKGGFVKGYILV
jgi:hypothetical protein